MDDWAAGMLLTWVVQGDEPTNEDETIAIAPDGTTWLWVRVPADPERGDVVGSFRTRVGGDVLERARDLAMRLDGIDTAAGAHGASVLISAEGVTRRVALRSAAPASRDVVALARTLAAAAFAEPIAAIRFAARYAPLPDLAAMPGVDPAALPELLRPGDGPTGLLTISLRGLGSEATGVVLDRTGFQAHWRRDGQPSGWTELPPPEVGLVGGGVLDGLSAPARIASGSSPGLALRAGLPDGDPDAVSVRVRGRIELVGPWDGPGVPSDAFAARTRETDVLRTTE